jgi:hypothetical protein
MTQLTAQARMMFEVREDFDKYAPACLHILTKKGELLPFEINDAQRVIHRAIEEQYAAIGKVRAIILKGRQQGASTYIEGRFYWKITGSFGKRAYILTHEDKATSNLFNMTKRYNDNCPLSHKPHTKLDNEKELYFDRLDCRYSVATAGARATGRSGTGQFFHGSEVAFWPAAETHMAGIGQTIPDEPDTEIILESTANGIGNLFHQKWQDAVDGKGEYIAIFVPWFLQQEYRKTCPSDVKWDDDELEYKDAFELSNEQMYWRRAKIVDDFKGDDTLFNQEYPGTPEMAFMAGTKDSLISPLLVARAQRNLDIELGGAIVIGVDPAEYGDDLTAIVVRQGRRVLRVLTFSKEGNAQIAGRVAMLAGEYDPDAICVDVTGVGTGVEAFLTDAGIKHVHRIHFGEGAIESEKYRNRAAEMWARARDWLLDSPAYVPKHARLQADLTTRKYSYDASRRLVLESKEKMKSRGLKSPDVGDGFALTFAINVQPRRRSKQETMADKLRKLAARHGRGGSPGMTA